MSKYILSCSSTADLSKEYLEKLDVKYICFHYELDGVAYPDDLGESMEFADFYKRMENGADTKTFQINADEFVEYFDKFLAEGYDVMHLCLSSGITGVVNSAMIAKDIMEEKYPDRKVIIVDSLAASSGYGLLMDSLAAMRDNGATLEELHTWIEKNKKKLHHWFFSTDLTFFIKGGRVSKTSGTIGNMLNICPLLNVDFEGKLIPRYKIRGKKKVVKAIVQRMEEHAEDGLQYAKKVFISHSACLQDAQAVASLVEEKFPSMDGKVEIFDIGTTIGSHTGPGTVALFFWGDERVD